jgi:hypothetical protein
LRGRGREHQDAAELLLNFLGWAEPDEESFAQDVRIVLVAADFGKELTTAVLWLNQRDLDIRCIRLQPYSDGARVLLNVQQVIPLPEAEEFQVQVREKARRERKARTDSRDMTRYNVEVMGRSLLDQSKRGALFHVVTTLVRDMGIAPEQVHEADLGRPLDGAWVVVDGEVDESTFIERAARDRKGQGYVFDPRRWYTADDELLRHGGRTYAFSKRWRTAKWLRAMENLKEAFPEAQIEFEPREKAGLLS